MNCEEALEWISGHIDQSNTPEEEAQLQAHLASCADCRAILAAYEDLDKDLSALKAEPPAELVRSVMDAVRQEVPAQRKIRRFPVRGIAATAVAAALLLVVGITYLPTLHSSDNAPAATPDAVSYTADVPSTDSSARIKSLPSAEESENTAATPEEASADVPETADFQQTDTTPQSDLVTTAQRPTETEEAGSAVTAASSGSTDDADSNPTAVVPSIMTVDAPSDAVQEAFPDGQSLPQLLVELVDNPDTPAASNIAELSQLTAESTATERIVFYECSAATIRQIVASYDTVYEFETPAQLDAAADSDTCGLLVIQP